MKTTNWVNVFHDKRLNKTLRKDGVVKFKLPNFNVDDYFSFLKKEVKGYPNEFEASFYGSVSLPDIEVKRKVDQYIQQRLSPALESILCNHRLLTYFFLIKGIGKESVLNLHQDWSIVDERIYRSYSLWIPLCDSTIKNGTLYLAKGTHRLPLNIRGGGIPPKFNEHFAIVEKYMEAIEVYEGEALIFDARILHYSPHNESEKSRTTIINNIIPKSAKTMCFNGSTLDDTFTINSYDVPYDLFIHYDNFHEQKDNPNPKGVLNSKIDYGNTSSIVENEFVKLLKATSSKKKNWFPLFR